MDQVVDPLFARGFQRAREHPHEMLMPCSEHGSRERRRALKHPREALPHVFEAPRAAGVHCDTVRSARELERPPTREHAREKPSYTAHSERARSPRCPLSPLR